MSNRPSNFDLSILGGSKPAKPKESDPAPAPQKESAVEATTTPPATRQAPKSRPAPAQSGFRTRRSADPLRRQRLAGRPKGEDKHQFNVRMNADAAANFIRLAEAEGVTYGDLVEMMMEQYERGRRGRS